MENLFDALATRYPCAARCAAALGISRQAFQQATARRALSNSAAIRAAALLNITPADALYINATGKDKPAPIDQPAPNSPRKPAKNRQVIQIMRTTRIQKKGDTQCNNPKYVHNITSKDQREATDLIRWVFAVANLRADSPRFNYYVSRWAVPEKIARAKQNGTFAALIANCPPIDPAWTRFVPAALAEYAAFIAPRKKPEPKALPSSAITPPERKSRRLVA